MTARKHLTERQVALIVTGDLPWLEMLRCRLHLALCPACRHQAATMRRWQQDLRGALDLLPEGLDWDSLSSEMRANIHLGLAVGAIVQPGTAWSETTVRWDWRVAAVTASVLLVVATAWVLEPAPPVPDLETSPGIALVLPAASDFPPAGRSIDFDGAESLLQVDQETGQLTITQTYGE